MSRNKQSRQYRRTWMKILSQDYRFALTKLQYPTIFHPLLSHYKLNKSSEVHHTLQIARETQCQKTFHREASIAFGTHQLIWNWDQIQSCPDQSQRPSRLCWQEAKKCDHQLWIRLQPGEHKNTLPPNVQSTNVPLRSAGVFKYFSTSFGITETWEKCRKWKENCDRKEWILISSWINAVQFRAFCRYPNCAPKRAQMSHTCARD
jgi:hypothetical protein